jgi:hypothetical protein
MLLYKYVTSERIDVLSAGRIRFTQPAEFNDPFEVAPSLAAMLPEGAEDSYLAQFEAQAVEALEHSLEEQLATLSVPPEVARALKTIALEQFGGKAVLALVKEELPHLVEALKPTLGISFQRSVGDRIGILSVANCPRAC